MIFNSFARFVASVDDRCYCCGNLHATDVQHTAQARLQIHCNRAQGIALIIVNLFMNKSRVDSDMNVTFSFSLGSFVSRIFL